MRSEYFCRMRSASALRFSNVCSSLNLLATKGQISLSIREEGATKYLRMAKPVH